VTQRESRQTHGSDARPAREIEEPLATFDLTGELARLQQEPAGHDPDKATITLTKADSFRLVLMSIRAGSTAGGDETHGAIAVHVLRGSVTVIRDADQVVLEEGRMAVVAPGRPWRMRAETDSALLLTLSWPEGGGAGFAE
jgi:quercetin dioxygenase-like cupin family protein